MKKIYYSLISVIYIMSQPWMASGSKLNLEEWTEIHQKATQGDSEAAYKLGEAWENGDQGLERNIYKAILSYNCAFKNGNKKAYDKLISFEEDYRNLVMNTIGNSKATGACFLCFGFYNYKGYLKNKDPLNQELSPNYKKALLSFEQPISLENKRKKEGQEITHTQKRWLRKAYMWIGVMLYRKKIDINDLNSLTFTNIFPNLKYSSSIQAACDFFQKAVELGDHKSKEYLKEANKKN